MSSLDGFEVEHGSLNFLKAELICCLVTSVNLIAENMTVTIMRAPCNVNPERNKRLLQNWSVSKLVDKFKLIFQ